MSVTLTTRAEESKEEREGSGHTYDRDFMKILDFALGLDRQERTMGNRVDQKSRKRSSSQTEEI